MADSPYKKALAAFDRLKSKTDKIQQKTTEVFREGVGTVEVSVGAFGAGYVNERYGVADKETGIRIHKTNGVPTTGLVGLGGKLLLGATDVAGEFTRDGYRVCDGLIGETCGTWGRMAGARQRIKAEKTIDVVASASTSLPNDKHAALDGAAKVNTTSADLVTAQKAAV